MSSSAPATTQAGPREQLQLRQRRFCHVFRSCHPCAQPPGPVVVRTRPAHSALGAAAVRPPPAQTRPAPGSRLARRARRGPARAASTGLAGRPRPRRLLSDRLWPGWRAGACPRVSVPRGPARLPPSPRGVAPLTGLRGTFSPGRVLGLCGRRHRRGRWALRAPGGGPGQSSRGHRPIALPGRARWGLGRGALASPHEKPPRGVPRAPPRAWLGRRVRHWRVPGATRVCLGHLSPPVVRLSSFSAMASSPRRISPPVHAPPAPPSGPQAAGVVVGTV